MFAMSVPFDADCIFCKIMSGVVTCDKVYEDEQIFAFMDSAPSNKGHTLVIPKGHFPTFLDVPEDVLQHWLVIVQRVARAVQQATETKGANAIINIGKDGGQVVFHSHFHIIPRFPEDGLKLFPSGAYDSPDESKNYAQRIASQLKETL